MRSILVMVNRFSKYTVFIIAPPLCPSNVQERLFYKNMIKHLKIPMDIVNDRDERFTGQC